jgi:FHA domain/Domain of unknown function (DUF4388)
MDSSLLELFSIEEIWERLSSKQSSGSLHVFTAKEAANLVFNEGTIIGATKGLVEGEEVLKQILEWKDVRCIWMAGLVPSTPPAKPLQLEVADFLFKLKVAPKIAIGGKTLSEPQLLTKSPTQMVPIPASAPNSTKSQFVSLATVSTTPQRVPLNVTDQLVRPTDEPAEAAVPRAAIPSPKEPQPGLAGARPIMTATRNILPDQEVRLTHEESLLRRHRLALVAVGDTPESKWRIRQISNLVGRNPACDITIHNGSVSRQHCLLQITDRGLHVKDLGTTNGTKVNGIVLTEGYVNIGDKLTIGNLLYVLEKDEEEDV